MEMSLQGFFSGRKVKLRAADFGCALPQAEGCSQRQQVLLETLTQLEAGPTDLYHKLAMKNVVHWRERAKQAESTAVTGVPCRVVVLPGDWGEVTLALTKEYGRTFASLNMANAYGPGGGYTQGMIAQEENMFRRTDCHFSLNRSRDMKGNRYNAGKTALLNAEGGRVYLDSSHPRVCIRGPEDRARPDLGYAWLPDDEV